MDNLGGFSYVVSAPGKVILFGEHSVVYKKAAVSTSISRRLSVTVSTVKENEISLKLPQINTEFVCSLDQFEKVVKEKCPLLNPNFGLDLDNPENINHSEYLQLLQLDLESLGISIQEHQEKTKAALIGFLFVMRGMCNSLNFNLMPFSLVVSSDLEVGAGTGSSAAFSVAIAGSVFQLRKCLEIVNNVESTKIQNVYDNVIIKSHSGKSGFSENEMKVINKWAYCIEKIMHGRPSGIDNTTSTFGSVVVTSQEPDRPGELTFRFLENVPRIPILLISTGVSRNTANLVAKVKHLRDYNCVAVDAIFNAMDVIAKEAFKTLEALGACSLDTAESAEFYRILGGLMELNHGLLRTLGVSHESLEHIVSVSSRYKMACKLTGAGGGGYAITLVPPNFSRDQIEAMKKELGSTFTVDEINISEEGVRLEKLVAGL